MADTDWTMKGLDNPQLIQSELLKRLEDATGTVVVDSNNPACILMEGFASMTAAQIKMVDDNVRPAIYPARAVTVSDLLKHISNYDYVNMFSSPATTTVLMIVDKTYITNHSLEVEGQTYKRMVIPKTTLFTVGEHTFGLYYPIEIRTNESTGSFSVVYNTEEKNPLKELETNILDYDFRYYNGLKLAYIKIPVYQFKIKTTEIVLISGSGYKKSLPYEDRFYALRCYAETLQNPGHDDSEEDQWKKTELDLAVAGQTYDVATPTVIFTPDVENNECLIEIPYVYFSNGLIRGKMTVEMYTTEGELNYQIPADTAEACTIDMFSNTLDATAVALAMPFRTMPALRVLPFGTTVTGGSNGMTMSELRDRVINGINTSLLQTPADIDAYFAAEGYTTTLLRDGITDRIFTIHTSVRNTSNSIIGADCIGTLLKVEDLANNACAVQSEASVYTLLPSMIYEYDKATGVCIPLSSADRRKLLDMSPANKVNAYNSHIYTISPFHLHVNMNSRYPTTVTYDMRDSELATRTFVKEREGVDCQLILNSASFDLVKGDLMDHYRLTFRVGRAGSLEEFTANNSNEDMETLKNFKVLVGIKNDDGEFRYGEAMFDQREDVYDIFHIDLVPNYKFHQANNDHTVQGSWWDYNKGAEATDLLLRSEVRVMLMARTDLIENLGNVITGNSFLETDYTNATVIVSSTVKDQSAGDFTTMSEHKLVIQLGSPVDEMDQRINLAIGSTSYLTYQTTLFRTLDIPEYKRDDEGHLVVTEDPTTHKPVIHELYPTGTLKCMTKHQEESVYLNEHVITNYLGCTKVVEAEESPVTEEDLGTTAAIQNAPITPRCTLTDSSDELNLNGSFELCDALTARALPSQTNVWAANGDKDVTLKSVNALQFLIGTNASNIRVKQVEAKPNDKFPYKSLTGDVGTFVIVNKDESEYSAHLTLETLSATSNTKLYYKVGEDKWECMVAAKTLASMQSIVQDKFAGDLMCGFAYVIFSGTTPKAIAFLTTTETVDGDIIPDFTPVSKYAWSADDDEEYIKAITKDPETGWLNVAGTWPWDVKQWYRFDQTNSRVIEDPMYFVFGTNRLYKYCVYMSNAVILDDAGQPIEDPEKPRTLQYQVDMLHIDAKHAAVTANEYNKSFPDSIVEVLRTHFDNIGNARDTMFTNTRLFFEPIRSLGMGSFNVGNNVVKQLPLDISLKFRLHITQAAYEDENVVDTIKQSVISIVDDNIANGYVNCAEIATAIMSELSDSVKYVDILGIDDDPDLQTMRCVDSDVLPHLKHTLVLLDDGQTIDLTRGVDIETVVND